jgi:hypothetical protein
MKGVVDDTSWDIFQPSLDILYDLKFCPTTKKE